MWTRTVSLWQVSPARSADDTTCATYQSDENGVCEFTLPPYAYEIHTLKLPEGYEGDTTTITTAPAEGGEMTDRVKEKVMVFLV